MTTDEILPWVWLAVLAIPLLVIYLALKNRQRLAGLTLRDMALALEAGVFLILVYVIQKWLFSAHAYFLLALPLFVGLFSAVIMFILSTRDVYVIETAHEGEKHYSLDDNKEVIVPHTRHRIIRMDRAVYEEKRHVGALHNQFWNGSPRVKFCDYYDEKIGVFFHHRLWQFHNFNFYAFRGFWEKMKMDISRLIDQNTILTFMSEYYLADKMYNMVDNLDLYLKSMNNQHCNVPFTMPETLEQVYQRRAAEAQHSPMTQETQPVQQAQQAQPAQGADTGVSE